MRVRQLCTVVAAAVCILIFGSYAGAQDAPCVQGFSGGLIYAVVGTPKNAPFSGVVMTTFEQKLGDGSAIHGTTRTHQARDAAGRTRAELPQGCARGDDGQMHERTFVIVNDLEARTNMSWQTGTEDQQKVVRVLHVPDLRPGRELSPEELARQKKTMEAMRARQSLEQKETKTEDLGTKQISGVTARGTRSTRTIPAGEEGNDQPLVVINETWRSSELGLVVMTVSDDPRQGRTTAEYEELNLGEPDPALFAPPAGYTVQEQPQTGSAGVVLQ